MTTDFFITRAGKPVAGIALSMACLLAASHLQATEPAYVNNAVVNLPPMVDATNFVNNGTFSIFTSQPYETYNTVNFTNRGSMSDFGGFRFSTTIPNSGLRKRAGNLDSRGAIDAQGGLAKILIDATNVTLRATNRLDATGLFQAAGNNIDMSRFALFLGYSGSFGDTIGTQSSFYWGVGSNRLAQASLDSPVASTPSHVVTNSAGTNSTILSNFSGVNYVDDVTVESNRTVRVAYLDNLNPDISNNVYFTESSIIVEWVWETFDVLTGELFTNHIYLSDDFGSSTNLAIPTNRAGAIILPPPNYDFTVTGFPLPGLSSPATPTGGSPGVFGNGTVSNEYSAYALRYSASSVVPGSQPGETAITNLPGRVQVTADATLDLKLARIAGASYMSLNATNHFKGAGGAIISSAYSDLNLGSTDGTLSVSNLIVPAIPKLVGEIRLYSGRWKQVEDGISNSYHILFVESPLQTTIDAFVQDVRLSAPNLAIADQELNVLRSFSADAQNLFIGTNSGINILFDDFLWPVAFPQLNTLTNQGFIITANAATFGSAADPYQAFVNSGSLSGQGIEVWTEYFENTGDVSSGVGNILLNGGDILLSGGSFTVGGFFGGGSGDISIAADKLVVLTHDLNAPGGLSLDIVNLLDDGGPGSGNQWSAGAYNGVSLLRKPAAGNLLGTTITVELDAYEQAPVVWAGSDTMGCDAAGFVDNAALQELVLDGGYASLFTFAGIGPGSALYVETLTLANFATNVDWALQIDTNSIRVYYAQAFADGADVSEALNGALDGALCWVSNYSGAFSSATIAYSATENVVMNASLAASSTIDSDADGIVNLADPTPLYTGSQVNLKLGLTPTVPVKPLLSWKTLPGAQNVVLYKESLAQTGWATLTNFTSSSNTASFVDQGAAVAGRLYRVQVKP